MAGTDAASRGNVPVPGSSRPPGDGCWRGQGGGITEEKTLFVLGGTCCLSRRDVTFALRWALSKV